MLVSGATSRYNCNKDACSGLDDATKRLFTSIQQHSNRIVEGLPLPPDARQQLTINANGVITVADAVIIAFVLKGLAASQRPGPQLKTRPTPQDVADNAEAIEAHLRACAGAMQQASAASLGSPVGDFLTTHKRQIVIGVGALAGVTLLWWGIRASFQSRQARQQPTRDERPELDEWPARSW